MNDIFYARILQPLLGALQLARFDAAGLTHMDDTRRGVWISFIAPLIALPIMLWFQAVQGQNTGPVTDIFSILRDALGYAVAVFGFPLAMHYVTRYLYRDARYNLLVAAVNWTAPWQTLIMGAAYLLYSSSYVPATAANLLLLCASSFNMVYIWFTVRTALGVTRGMAVLIVSLMAMIQLVGWLLTQIGQGV